MGVEEESHGEARTEEKKASSHSRVQGGAVRLVREGGRSIAQVCEEFDLAGSVLRTWLTQAEVDAGEGAPQALTSAEKHELSALRREVKVLRMEREILKRAAANFARDVK